MAVNLNQLNAQQREAVLHPLGPLLILAGAGSGKTSTMTYRIAHLIADRHVSAENILGLSFTNKAATELKDRVKRLVIEQAGRRAIKGLTITTFHSLCARLLRAHAEHLGFQNNFTILDQNDQLDVLKQILKQIHIDDRRFDVDVILFQIGQAKNRLLSPEQAQEYFLEKGKMSSDYAIATASCFPRYQEQLKILNAMDFDDLIYQTVRLLENHQEVRDYYNAFFRHILVDEYQDTNPSQFRILRLLTQKQQNICVVGDDDQSIYAWRGADPTHILEFSHHFPSARVIALEQNYRSTSRILEAANKVIENNKNRFSKKLWSDRGLGEPISEIIVEEDRAEAEFVAHEIQKRLKELSFQCKDFAILYRSNAQSRLFEEALRRNGIPYKIVGGLSFLARKEVKDVLSYWRLISNPKDDASLRRVINWPTRGIGKTSIEALSQWAFQNHKPLFEALEKSAEIAPKSSSAIQTFRELIHSLEQELVALPADAALVSQWAKRSLERLKIQSALLEDSDDPVQAAKKWENVEELIHSIGQLTVDEGVQGGEGFLREFLNRMALEANEEEKSQEDQEDESKKNQVTLLTLHGAKGLEYRMVFLVGMEEGFLPHKRTIDEAIDFGEERRLCYVGITRAKEHLYLTRTKNRIRYGKPVPRSPSRFLEEIPKDLLVRIDESLSPDYTSQQAREEHETKVKDYLAQIRANLLTKK